jgi:UDP:flavonoid glycosyltransferase YjiC (YdhE family)
VIDELSGLPVQVVVSTGHAVDPADLIAAENTVVARFLDHDELLSRATAMVSHCGLGSTLNSLAHAVPLVCVPMGRDQQFNAAMAVKLGAGIAVDLDRPGTFSRSVEHALFDTRIQASAHAFAVVLARYRGADAAVEALEELARP